MIWLICIGCLLIGLGIGRSIGIYEKKAGEETVGISPKELCDLIEQLFSDPEKDYAKKLERSKSRMSLAFPDGTPDEILLAGYKENILQSLSAEPGMKDPFPRDKAEQVKEMTPKGLTEEEEKIFESREAMAKTQKVIDGSPRAKGHEG